MNVRAGNGFFPITLTVAAWAFGAQGGTAQEVRARVVDEQSRSGIGRATVLLLSTDSTEIAHAETGPDGFFQLVAPEAGSFLIRVEHFGYESVTRPVALTRGSVLLPAFVLPVTAITLDTLNVEAPRSSVTPYGAVGFSRPSYLLAGERMAALEKTGVSFTGAVRELGAGLRFRSVRVGGRSYTCITSTRASYPSGCNMVAIIVDGIDIGLSGPAAMEFVHYLHLQDWESVEYLSPVEAGFRYGLNASSKGALVLWTRGQGPHKSKARGGGG